MKLSTLTTLFALSTASAAAAAAAVLDARQQCFSSDACYSAVFGDGSMSRVVQAVADCEDFLTTSVIWHPVYVKDAHIHNFLEDNCFLLLLLSSQKYNEESIN
jgi:hypothetical protein